MSAAATTILLPILTQAGAPILKGLIRQHMGPRSARIAEDVVDAIAGRLGTEPTPEAISAAHRDDPDQVEGTIRQIEADKAELWLTYLELIRADATADSWVQRLWRPANGFLFGLACTALLLTVCAVVLTGQDLTEGAVALLALVGPTIVAWAGVVGAYVVNRTKEKTARA